MNSSKEEHTRHTKVEETPGISNQIDVDGKADILRSGEDNIIPSSSEDKVVKDPERAKLQWEYEQFLAKFMFFLDLGWKAVGLFYAVLGGIIVIYFAKESSNKDVIKFLLYAPLIMSMILSLCFLGSGIVWMNLIPKLDEIVTKLEMTTTPNFRILTSLFFVFALTLIATAFGLFWLIQRLV